MHPNIKLVKKLLQVPIQTLEIRRKYQVKAKILVMGIKREKEYIPQIVKQLKDRRLREIRLKEN